MEWQDISTAPRDGTLVLVYGPWACEISGPAEPAMTTASWTDRTDYVGYNWYVECTGYAAAWVAATHWMPLPNPPAPPPERGDAR